MMKNSQPHTKLILIDDLYEDLFGRIWERSRPVHACQWLQSRQLTLVADHSPLLAIEYGPSEGEGIGYKSDYSDRVCLQWQRNFNFS
ncbi:Uncharacterized protein TCM_006882 [Theobroma cacao]|uniref:Uncharacterized protein n=1 Tax=Theobroma cacao TaxID=3641 RepID=A0A061E0Z6_THECC|nr:Uncharacterized protein TCM_006882 [Theobroma cacao]